MALRLSKTEIESNLAPRFGQILKVREKSHAEVLSTGIEQVDEISAGFPRGAVTEVSGSASSGRTSFMLAAFASAIAHEEICALVDVHDAFDPLSAAASGIDLDQLLWVRCGGNVEHAFKVTDLLLHAGGFGLIALDMCDVDPACSSRIISSWWYRFRHTIENTPTVFLVFNQQPCVKSCASLSIALSQEETSWSDTKPAQSSDPLNSPSHSQLLRGLRLNVARNKPVWLGTREARLDLRTAASAR